MHVVSVRDSYEDTNCCKIVENWVVWIVNVTVQ